MDDGHPAGRGHVAGHEKLLLARRPPPLRIFNAWSDEPWINDGAAVRVSLVCFAAGAGPAVLDDLPVQAIYADLTGSPLAGVGRGSDLTGARRLPENTDVSFQGSQKIGPFDIPGELARTWLDRPNPHGRPNAEVLKPSWNGLDVTRRPRDVWIIDFGTTLGEAESAMFEAPFQYVLKHVKPERILNPRPIRAKNWWRHGDSQPAMRAALSGQSRYIATPHVSKHRLFVWMDKTILPDKMLIAIARADDATFGILHSRFHQLWSLGLCTWLGKGNDPRYTPTTTFETFPFPEGLTPADTRPRAAAPAASVGARPAGRPVEANPAGLAPGIVEGTRLLQATPILPNLADPARLPVAEAIAKAAFDLNRLRENWLNPSEWVEWVITPEEEQAGFPARPVAKPGHESDLKQRTLTNLYNARPAWLAMAHAALDQAVAAAYGWDDYTPALPDEEILRRLLALNEDRSSR